MAAQPLKLYCLNATLRIKPERRDAFLTCIGNAVVETHKEPLAVSYLFGEDESEPNVFHVHQAYQGREGFDAHRETPHYEAWQHFAATDPFVALPEGYVFVADLVPSAAAPTEPPVLCLNVRFTVKPERRDEFLREIDADQRGTMSNEPLAKVMLVGEDVSAPNTFHLHEQFCCGREGFKAHLAAPHFQPWQAFVDSEPFTDGLISASYYPMGSVASDPAAELPAS